MNEEQFIILLNQQLEFSPLEKNALYHNLLEIIRSNIDEKSKTQEIFLSFIEIMDEKRSTLKQMIVGDVPTTHKPGLFRRVQ